MTPKAKKDTAYATGDKSTPPGLIDQILILPLQKMCHADLEDARLEAWSRGNVHWRHCWQEENSQRVLETIDTALSSGII